MPSSPTRGTGDALASQSVAAARVPIDWCIANSINTNRLCFTEMGFPGSSQAATDPIPGSGTGAKPDLQWDNVHQQIYELFNFYNVSVTEWNASEWRVDLRGLETSDGNNGPFTYRTTPSSVLMNNLSTINYKRGYNYAGGEFSDQGPNGVLNRSHLSQPGAGYYYPTPSNFSLIAGALNIKFWRIPVRWERIQPTLLGALDTAEMAAIDVSINAAIAAGCDVFLDIHNYARYDTVATGANANGVYNLGQNAPSAIGGTMNTAYGDLMTKLTTWSNGRLWGLDIMNEPHDLAGGVTDWQVASRVAVEAIRAQEKVLSLSPMKILVEGYSYSSAANWTSVNGSTPWLTETIPTGQTGAGSARNTDANVWFAPHFYPDPRSNGNDGGFQDTYADELAFATSAGYSSYSTGGYVAPSTGNTNQSGVRTNFKSSFDSQSDFANSFDAVSVNSNTVTFPFAGIGNPGNSMKLVCSTTSDEGGVRKNLPGVPPSGMNSRIIQFDFQLDPASSLDTTATLANFCILHLWDGTFQNDLAEIRIVGVLGDPAHFKMQINKTTDYVPVTGSTLLTRGLWHTIKVVVTDAAYQVFIDGGGSPEVSYTSTNTGLNVGGMALGKFYGTQALTMYFDNLSVGLNATYDAPPSGGIIVPAAGGAVPQRGLIGVV